MRINSTTRILGKGVILVPYQPHHVVKYHEWMSRQEIQELTCSEPLTLEEEYAMQQKWSNDQDKLTFLILNKEVFDHESCPTDDLNQREVNAMIGDVNCFIQEEECDDDETKSVFIGELDIMIVEHDQRKRGLGIESMRLMINYCVTNVINSMTHLPSLASFVVKIDEANTPSIRMFEKLGFSKHRYVEAFRQVTLKLDIKQEEAALLFVLRDEASFRIETDYKA
jgi:RimJ/RimL family protein N-acetyltransferase